MSNHYLMSERDGASFLEKLTAPEFSAADYRGWEALGLDAAGLSIFMFKVAAGAEEYPLHAAPDEWLGYVVAGGGELYSGNGEGEKLDSVPFQAGDWITFKPNTQHAWKNGAEESKILFAKVA